MPHKKRELARAGEHGAVSIKMILAVAIVVTAVFLVWQFAPVYLNEQRVKHDVDELARVGANQSLKPERLAQRIKDIRREYSFLGEDSITVTGTTERTMQITLKYNVNIDLLVTTYAWKVDYVTVGKGL